MGQVTFNGNEATVESQVYIREQELEILSGPGDHFSKARKVEQLYLQNGLVPGSFRKLGADYDFNASKYDQEDVRHVHYSDGDVAGNLKIVFFIVVIGALAILFGEPLTKLIDFILAKLVYS